MHTKVIFLGSAFFLWAAAGALAQSTAQGLLDKGAEAFNRGDHAAAVQAFRAAVEAAPGDVNARLHLAHAYLQQVGLKRAADENMLLASQSAREYEGALERDRTSANAMLGLAAAAYRMGNLNEARSWCRKAVQAEPRNADIYVTLGFLNFVEANRKGLPVEPVTGKTPSDPGPIRDPKLRYRLRYQWLPLLEEAEKMIDRALEIDASHERALAYKGLIIHRKADFAESAADYRHTVTQAMTWGQRSSDLRAKLGPPTPIRLDSRQPPPLPLLAPPPPPELPMP